MPTLQIDNLYRGIAQGLYRDQPGIDLTDKRPWCGACRPTGWLIDATDQPINYLPSTRGGRHKQRTPARRSLR